MVLNLFAPRIHSGNFIKFEVIMNIKVIACLMAPKLRAATNLDD